MINTINELIGRLRGPSVRLFVDVLNGTRTAGWAWCPSRPDERLTLEILDGQEVIGEVVADNYREDLEKAGKGDGRYAFEFRFPKMIPTSRLHRISFRRKGHKRPERTPKFKQLSAQLFVDVFDGTHAAGWAWLPSRPNEYLTLEILDGDKIIGEAVAGDYRVDLEQAGKGNGCHGFNFQFPASVFDGKSHQIHIRNQCEDQNLYSSPEIVIGKLTVDVDSFFFGFASGTARVLENEMQRVPFRVTLNEKEMFSGSSGNNCQIQMSETLTAEKFETLVKLDAKIRMDLYVQDILAKSVHYEKISSRKQDFCVLITNRTSKEIAGQIITQAAPPRRYMISIQGERTDELAMDAHGNFSIPLARYRLDNGRVAVRIEAFADTDGEHQASENSHVQLELDYSRYEASVEISDNQIAGLIKDFWSEDGAEKGVEILIDGRSAAFEIAKYNHGLSDPAWAFGSAISERLFDGAPHTVQCRIVESGFVFPARPLMFTTDDQSKAAMIRMEQQSCGQVRGWAMLPWSPETIVEVSALFDDQTIATVRCDAFHPMLASNGLLPTDRGFSLDLSNHPDGHYTLNFVADGKLVSSRGIRKAPFAPFILRDSGCERRGTCFVIPNPRGDVQQREEARSILLLAAAATEAGGNPTTIVIADQEVTQAPELRSTVTDLIGSVATEALAQAEFVALPRPPLDSTISGTQTAAYWLDIWMRANQFDRLVAPSRNGVAAYCVSSRRQGTGGVANTITILVDTFAIVDALACDTLLDRPGLLFTEALEREALNGADELIAPSVLAANRCNEVVRDISTKVQVAAQSVGEAHKGARFIADPDVNWLFFAGPLNTPAGLVLVCDAMDRLARKIQGTDKTIGVAFAGPEDLARGKRAGDYVRQRAAKWPFRIRMFRDLNFDSLRRIAAGYGERDAIALTPPPLIGTPWDALCDAAGLQRLALDGIRQDNSSDFAEAIFQALENDPATQTQPVGNALGRSLAAPTSVPGSAQPQDRETLARPLVSVCVSHFNRPTLLRQTLASIMACGYPNLEIVVLDDGSHLPGVASELQQVVDETAPGISRIVRQRNSYVGAVRNAAARSARGDLLIFMDDDNLAHPDMIANFVDAHHKTGAGIVTSRFGLFNSTDVIDPSSDIPDAVGVPLMPDRGAGVISNCFGDANMLITRQALEAIGGFTEDYGRGHEDWELLAKAAMGGIHQELLTKPVFWYRVSDSGMLRNRESEIVDLQRNIRAYRDRLPTEIYRLLQLAQGMVHRWDNKIEQHHIVPRAPLNVVRQQAFGRVAIIMRTKDRPVLLKRAIESVLGQTFTDWALVIVNDGGDPGPVRKLIEKHKTALQGRALLINNPSSTGMENASNAGITNSISEFAVIHDDDDAWHPTFLQTTIAHLDRSPPEVGGVVTHATVVIEEIEGNQVIERNRFPFNNVETIDLAKLSMENQFPPITFLFKRSIMDVIGQFDGRLPVLGDWDFHLRAAKTFRLEVIAEPLAFYHHRVEGTGGHYGNTVVAGKDRHRRQRAEFITANMRDALAAKRGEKAISDGELLYFGEQHRDVVDRMTGLSEHMHWLEKMLNDQAAHMKTLESIIKKG